VGNFWETGSIGGREGICSHGGISTGNGWGRKRIEIGKRSSSSCGLRKEGPFERCVAILGRERGG